MRRRDFVTLVGGAAVAWPLVARAQEAGRTYRLGVLWPFPRDTREAGLMADVLRPHGFIEGKNLTVDYRGWALHVDQISEYAAELIKARVDVIAAGGDVAIRAAQQVTKTVPILGVTDDMVGSGLVSSMARPDGNTTGISILAPELDGKRQEILTEALPGLRRMAVLADSRRQQLRGLTPCKRQLTRATSSFQFIGSPEARRSPQPSTWRRQRAPQRSTFWRHRCSIAIVSLLSAASQRLPAIYQWPETGEEGGFAAYGPRFDQIIRELHARQLVQLFRGVKVADIPVEQPTKFELVINLKSADALGLMVPPTLLARADKVIE